MFYKRDWILRQIQMIADMIAQAVFHKSVIVYQSENEIAPTQTDRLFSRLDVLVEQGEIGEAEDLLFGGIEAGNQKHLELAMDFYRKINRMSDEELEKCSFPRQEILDGLNAVVKKFGLSDIVN